jgi:adenylate cyclase
MTSFAERLARRKRPRGLDTAQSTGCVRRAGERRDIGVVHVELVSASRLAQTRSAPEVVRIVNLFFDTITAAFHEEDGCVRQCGAHAAVGLFGVPKTHDDDAGRALRAALLCRAELFALSAAHAEVDFAMGVSAGPAVVHLHQDFDCGCDAIGPPIEEAIRLVDRSQLRFHRLLASEEAVDRARADTSEWVVAEEIELTASIPTLAYEPAGPRIPEER